MNANQIDAIGAIASVILLAVFLVMGDFLTLILAVGLMVVMAGISEAGRSGLRRKGAFLLITFLMDLAVFVFLFPGSYPDGILFALAGVIIAALSKGHLGRALAFTFFASPILMVVLLPVSALMLEGLLPSDAITFVGFSVLISFAIVLTNLPVALVFRGTGIGRVRGYPLSNPTTGLYWGSAFWLYVLQSSQNLSAYTTLPETVLLWILFVVVTHEGSGFVSKIVAGRVGVFPRDLTQIY